MGEEEEEDHDGGGGGGGGEDGGVASSRILELLELEGVNGEGHVLLVGAAAVLRLLAAAVGRREVPGAVHDGSEHRRDGGDVRRPVPREQPRQAHQLAVSSEHPARPISPSGAGAAAPHASPQLHPENPHKKKQTASQTLLQTL